MPSCRDPPTTYTERRNSQPSQDYGSDATNRTLKKKKKKKYQQYEKKQDNGLLATYVWRVCPSCLRSKMIADCCTQGQSTDYAVQKENR
jgi:hypothetical protein